jgi:hypothetical protein
MELIYSDKTICSFLSSYQFSAPNFVTQIVKTAANKSIIKNPIKNRRENYLSVFIKYFKSKK